MAYKFEDLEVWQKALDYADRIHDIAEQLPKHERYNLSEDRGRQTADGGWTAARFEDTSLMTPWREIDGL
jgi:hypothetical protein